MRKSKLLNLSVHRDYVLIEKENGFRMDFSGEKQLTAMSDFEEVRQTRKKGIVNILLLLFIFLFTNFLFAQAPACNLIGPLKATPSKAKVMLEPLEFSAEVINDRPNTIYQWSFKTNNTQARLITRNGKKTIGVHPGAKAGSFTIQLTVTNVNSNGQNESCTCTQSVSVNN